MILITGASGFVGQALANRLTASGFCIRAASRRHDLGSCWVASPDLSDRADWRHVLDKVEVVVHTAGRAHVLKEVERDPLSAFRATNTLGTIRLAEQAAQAGVRRFVFLSSIGVNGNRSDRPFTETDEPAPQDAYAVSKLEAEQALVQLAKTTGMEVVIVRPPLVYGPGAPGNFGRLMEAVRRRVPLPLGAVTDNRRTLVALDNLVDLIVECITQPAAANQVFLAGDSEDLSTADLLRRLSRVLGVTPLLPAVPLRVLTAGAAIFGKRRLIDRLVGSLQVDISKARDVLGWVPPVDVDEGLRRAAQAFRE